MVRNFRGSYTDVSKNILVYSLTVTPTNLMTLGVKLKKFFDVEDDFIQKNLRNSPATPKKIIIEREQQWLRLSKFIFMNANK